MKVEDVSHEYAESDQAKALMAFMAFDWKNDELWKEKEGRLEILPSTPEDKVLRMKARWFKQTINGALDVEKAVAVILSDRPGGMPAPGAASSTAAKPAATQPQQRPVSGPSQTRPGTGSSGAGATAPQAERGRTTGGAPARLSGMDLAYLISHAVAVVGLLVCWLPAPAALRVLAFTWCARANLAAALMRLMRRYGAPRSLFALSALRTWFTQVIGAGE